MNLNPANMFCAHDFAGIATYMQTSIEAFGGLPSHPHVINFLIDEATRQSLSHSGSRCPDEELLWTMADGEQYVGLFLHPGVTVNLTGCNPLQQLDDDNLASFCLALEGISHYVWSSFCLSMDRPISPLELEIMAEVDKFVNAAALWQVQRPGQAKNHRYLLQWMFEQASLQPELSEEELRRYGKAHCVGHAFCKRLSGLALAGPHGFQHPAVLRALRQFMHAPLPQKLHIDC